MSTIDRLAAITSGRARPSVAPCGSALGDLCVVVSRSDRPGEGVAAVDVSLSGPSPGDAVTDGSGVAEFSGRSPGDYRFRVSLPEASRHRWLIAPYGGGAAVAEGEVSIADVLVTPVGTLVVEIRHENGELISGGADITVAGARALAGRIERGTHTYPGVPCGDYDVTADVSWRNESWHLSAPRATVPHAGVALASLVLRPRTWIEIELVAADGSGVANEPYLIVASDGQEFRGVTDASGVARLDGLMPGDCSISFTALDRDAWRPL